MKRVAGNHGPSMILAYVLLVASWPLGLRAAAPPAPPEATRALAHEVTANGAAYANLRELTDLGPRLSGSDNASRAVRWAQEKMQGYGFDRVWLQPVTVPHWVRGAVERAIARHAGTDTALRITALGGSIGTAPGGLDAQVLVVHSLAEVAALGARVRGKIVFYNRPMDPTTLDTFAAYGNAVDQRTAGASQAARHGAVAVLVRSLTTLPDDDHPHTGMVHYRPDAAKIPAAALSTHAANTLAALLAQDPTTEVHLELSALSLAPVVSYNVIGELRGRERPHEIVVVGGHLDSWDLSPGAHDDGAGVVQSIEVGRALQTLGWRPRRTVRVVLFMAEEEGAIGGEVYANQALTHGETHVAAVESDTGGFAPAGFDVEASTAALQTARGWAPYLAALHAAEFAVGESGADIGYLAAQGVPSFGFRHTSRHYFDLHHSDLDQLAAVAPDALHAGAAAITVLVYLASEIGF